MTISMRGNYNWLISYAFLIVQLALIASRWRSGIETSEMNHEASIITYGACTGNQDFSGGYLSRPYPGNTLPTARWVCAAPPPTSFLTILVSVDYAYLLFSVYFSTFLSITFTYRVETLN